MQNRMKVFMKLRMLYVIIMLLLAVIFSSCGNDDIDMSKIDFSNIENLYAQPLPVIQKCVQGKWKWDVKANGGPWGIPEENYPIVEIFNDHIVHMDNGKSYFYKWKKHTANYWTIRGEKTFAMEFNEYIEITRRYFLYIKNDTLLIVSDIVPPNGDPHSLNTYIRIK